MPNQKSSDTIEQRSRKDVKGSQSLNPPALPDNPSSPNASAVSSQEVQTQVKKLEDQVRRAEKWMIWLTAAIAFFGLCQVIASLLQWRTMSGQLREMKSSGVDTHVLAEAAKKQAEKAETISGSIQKAVGQMATTNLRSKQVLDATIAASQLDQRAWVGVVDIITEGGKVEGGGFSFKDIGLAIRNTGKTPALRVTVDCCSYITRPWSDREIPDYDTEMARNQEREKTDLVKRIKQHPDMAEQMTRRYEEWKEELRAMEGRERHEGTLAPQAVIVFNTGFSMSVAGVELLPPPKDIKPEEMHPYLEKMSRGPMLIYAVGKIVYSDIFPNTKQHTTTICVARNPGPNSVNFGPCAQGRMD
jgi:hypothetical protein